ncbi:WD domain-containing protein, G-beta repeat-containing protein [Stigmatella aurantiaca]|uniref:WD domain-containing protein, G-beta repeat-containing protein n=1 Tax=Stigmatella aurantiaca TaxID=41 RepID=A0A1H8D922_STIAU|nr:2OG-Fe(II) oxygenase [Stigmatella aurantiaca]SEN02997.1 WD domain-containing protein, G-beta repeat-containing protein [Stigmatella aurantiaca]
MRPIYPGAADIVWEAADVRTPLPCFLLRGVFSRSECLGLIQEAERVGFQATGRDYPPSYRDNDRQVHDDAALADTVFARLRPFLPERLVDASGDTWHLQGLNPRFRYCRYRGGQRFCIHRDGAYAPSPRVRSHLTCMLYLNDAQEFSGGATRYYADRSEEAELLGAVRPEAGTLIVFDHALWHDGEAVSAGTKYVLRTDVLYEREAPAHRGLDGVLTGHQGYVWSVLARRDGRLATASRDGTVRLWRASAGRWDCDAVLTGHTASALALAEDTQGQLWSASRDRTVRRWDTGTAHVVGRHEGAVLSLAALDDGRVASGGADGRIQLWSSDGSAPDVLPGHTGWVWALAALPGGWLASASEDGTVRLWRTSRPHETLSSVPAGAPVRALAVLPDGRLVSGQATGELTLWQPSFSPHPTLQALHTQRVHTGAVCALAPVSGGQLASGGEDDGIHLTRLPDFTQLSRHPHADFVRGLAVLPGNLLVSASYDTTVRLWPVESPGGTPA